jgi:hypothetical protein
MVLLLVTVSTIAGCGDSEENYVFTGTAGNTPTTGSLTFNFNQANIPADVQQLLFDFYTGANGTGANVLSTQRPFAGSVTIENVPGSASSVVITGLNTSGDPQVTIVAPVVVAVGGNRVVDLSNATFTAVTLAAVVVSPSTASVDVGGTQQYTATGTFSNGQSKTITGVTYSVTGPATITPAGLATGTGAGTATITGARDGVSDTATLQVNAIEPEGLESISTTPENLPIELGQTGQLTTTGTFTDPNDNRELTAADGLTYVSSDENVATVDGDGTVTAVGVGQATITSDVGEFSDTSTIVVSDQPGNNDNPVVTVDGETLDYERDSAAVAIFPNATVTDDQVNLAGGTLNISGNGNSTGLVLDAPATPDIGTVTGDGTSALSVMLDQGATPANIQAFLRAVNVSTAGATAAFGSQEISATLTDGQGGVGSDSRTFNVQDAGAGTITVGPAMSDDFARIQDAIDDVAANPTGAGSVITVAPGTYPTDGPLNNGTVVISNDPSLTGLTLRGANAGISAGSTPGTRGAESIVGAFAVDNRVTIDGFELTGGAFASAGPDPIGVFFDNESSSSVLRNNDLDQTTALAPGSRGVLTSLGGVPTNLTIERNGFRDWISGTFLQGTPMLPTSGHLVQENLFNNNGVGSGNDSIENTQFLNNVYGVATLLEHIGISDAGAGVVMTGNDFASTGAINLYVSPGATVDAELNWWGQASGPLVTQTGPDGGTIDTTPFLTSDPFPAQP